jgi:hypothetical protein
MNHYEVRIITKQFQNPGAIAASRAFAILNKCSCCGVVAVVAEQPFSIDYANYATAAAPISSTSALVEG